MPSIFSLFSHLDSVPAEDAPAASSWPVIGAVSEYGAGWCRIKVVCDEEWEWGCLKIDFADDCDPVPEDHWLEWERDALGDLSCILSLDAREDTIQFMMEHGIAPDQPFWIEASYSTSRDYWGEWDCDIDWKVVGYETWPRERVMLAWEAFYGREAMLCR